MEREQNLRMNFQVVYPAHMVTDLPPPACVKQVIVMMSPQPAGLRGITDTL